MNVCTIVARNYLAQARVLAASFQEHHPGGSFTVLIVDEISRPPDLSDEPFEILATGEIGLDVAEIHRMAMIYNVTEFSTALKPWLLRHMLRSSPQVVYFDPDIEIFAPLEDLAVLAGGHSIVLTPHTTVPMPRDKRTLSETDILGAGIYNLGFIAVGDGCGPFLDWWSERLRRESIVAPVQMRFTDQRWIDFVPGLFPHYILRDTTCNVAYWNLYGRALAWTGSRYEVDGRPLRFFHFSGYDPDVPFMLSRHHGLKPRTLLSAHPAVAKICGEYAEKLVRAGFHGATQGGYGYDMVESGLPVDSHMRRVYRQVLEAHEEKGGQEPPNPFAPGGGERFLEWLGQPVACGAGFQFSRYIMALRESRIDVQAAFPDVTGEHAQAFYDWAHANGSWEEKIDSRLLPRMPPAIPSPEPVISSAGPEPVVAVAGYFHAELGIGEAARLLLTALDASQTPYTTVSCRDTSNRQEHLFEGQPSGSTANDINIVCVNADQIASFARKMGADFFHGRHTVGVWFWESEDFPASMHAGFNFVDEIWVASDFIREALHRISPKPIFTFPLPAGAQKNYPHLTKVQLGLPDAFVFLFSFDFLSVFERKNPIAIIDAFKQAFAPGEGPVLVLKCINGDMDIVHLEKLHFMAAGRSDIRIMNQYMSAAQKNALMAAADCYVSLHRAEGYGLTMAEAMVCGKPVIATNYSGNLTFMDDTNSFLCPFTFQQVGPGSPPYLPTAKWAAPDIAVAARLMRYVHDHPEIAAERGKKGREDLLA
ncbi:MAG: glycosyltransferase, partial [Chthoniobacteraceae bacterium]